MNSIYFYSKEHDWVKYQSSFKREKIESWISIHLAPIYHSIEAKAYENMIENPNPYLIVVANEKS